MKIGQFNRLPLDLRFWQRVAIGDEDECWVWLGYVGSRGYGYIKNHYQTRLSHRVSYELAHGEIPEGLSVCHHCDNPLCVNPAHLFLGTPQDNASDMCRKGRQPRPKGEKHGCAKLTEKDVAAIRASNEKGRTLAAKYGVSPATISNIRTGKSWAHASRISER